MKIKNKYVLVAAMLVSPLVAEAQEWMPDNGNGTYTNPIIDADYSDPDVCLRGTDYYMTASSFNCMPGLPILHSKDLVNWKIVGHALPEIEPTEKYDLPQHGKGVFAPSIRVHNDSLFIYYADPDEGIYMVKCKNPDEGWEKPVMVKKGRGYIDPCPLWDEDGKAYLIHALAGSRVRQSGLLIMNKLSADGKQVLDGQGRVVYDGHGENAVIEGPKLYKHGGYYWIFAPAGGVGNGYQLAMRSKDIMGPYEWRKVLASGKNTINGPHQGGWVTTPDGKEDWFVHFQHKKPVGRVVHLEPMKWRSDGWPVMGIDKDGDGMGEPVTKYKKPNIVGLAKTKPFAPQASEEFNDRQIGLQWQWQANPKVYWAYPAGEKGKLRLFATAQNYTGNLWQCPNLLLQKFPSEAFSVVTKVTFTDTEQGLDERAGLVVMGGNYATLAFEHTEDGLRLQLNVCEKAESKESEEKVVFSTMPKSKTVWLKMDMANSRCTFSYSWDGVKYEKIDCKFLAAEGKWIGAKVGLFCNRPWKAKTGGWLDADYFRVTNHARK